MRVARISDVRANPPAHEGVFDEIAASGGVTAKYHLGDRRTSAMGGPAVR